MEGGGHTFFGWQCVLLLSLRLLQLRLVEGGDFCDVGFVGHVCGGSGRTRDQKTSVITLVFYFTHPIEDDTEHEIFAGVN